MDIIVIGILASEIGFWVVLAAGLIVRYALRLRRLSNALLLCVPLLDLVLLTLIVWDLVVSGSTAGFTHGLGAVYLGFTVAFGHQLISAVDARVAHRFAGGPPPARPPKSGAAYVRYEWKSWLRMLLCAVITTAVVAVIALIVRNPSQTAAFAEWVGRIWLVALIWLVGWPIWATIAHLTRSAAHQTVDHPSYGPTRRGSTRTCGDPLSDERSAE